MVGGVGHTGGLTNPLPWRGRYQAGYSNTGGPPLPRKRAPLPKKNKEQDTNTCQDRMKKGKKGVAKGRASTAVYKFSSKFAKGDEIG